MSDAADVRIKTHNAIRPILWGSVNEETSAKLGFAAKEIIGCGTPGVTIAAVPLRDRWKVPSVGLNLLIPAV